MSAEFGTRFHIPLPDKDIAASISSFGLTEIA